MIIAKEIQLKYQDIIDNLKQMKKIVDTTLLTYCNKKEFAYCSRIKSIGSLAEKIESGRFLKWEDIDDLFAATIIIPNLNFEKNVIEFLEKAFIVKEIKKRNSTLKAPDVFRFDSTRIILNLNPSSTNSNNIISNQIFEVQIKSAFEYAWSIATHQLSYKTNTIDWKLLRLSAQIKAIVEQLDTIIVNAKKINKFIVESKWPEIEMEKDILKFFKDLIERKAIPDILIPRNLNRFCQNLLNIIKSNPEFKEKQNFKPIKKYFEAIKSEIESFSDDFFPKSISLFQFCIGCFAKNNLIYESKCSLLITEELMLLYPDVRKFNKKFII